MNLLLDTHALIWLFEGDEHLGKNARTYIENPENTNFISIATFWEIAIKHSINKLEMDMNIEDLQRLV